MTKMSDLSDDEYDSMKFAVENRNLLGSKSYQVVAYTSKRAFIVRDFDTERAARKWWKDTYPTVPHHSSDKLWRRIY